jgi:hypothetical protein
VGACRLAARRSGAAAPSQQPAAPTEGEVSVDGPRCNSVLIAQLLVTSDARSLTIGGPLHDATHRLCCPRKAGAQPTGSAGTSRSQSRSRRGTTALPVHARKERSEPRGCVAPDHGGDGAAAASGRFRFARAVRRPRRRAGASGLTCAQAGCFAASRSCGARCTSVGVVASLRGCACRGRRVYRTS